MVQDTRSQLFVLTLCAALVWGAVPPAAAQKPGGTLVLLVQPEPPNLAPHISTSAPIGMVTAKIYDGLLEYDFNLKPLPSLAKSWTVSPDGKSVTFKLQENVKWHDGKPLTSADVQYSILEVLKKAHPRGASTFRDVTAIETPDPHTAVFRLARPAPYVMMALSGYESPIVPKHLVEGTDVRKNDLVNKPVGSGPFRFVEWQRGQYVRLDKNPAYWKPGRPYLDRIVARFITDSATRTAALEKEEAHIGGFGAIPYSDVVALAKKPHIEVTRQGYEMSSPIVELGFNTRKPPFDNQKVRQAIAHAVDRKFVVDNIWFGFGKPATGPINSNFAPVGFYTPEVKRYDGPDRIATANRLLDEAGYPKKADGTRFEIVHDLTPYGEEWQRFGEYMRQVFGQLGIKATLRYEDVPTWLKRVYTDYDFQITSNWLQTLADPVIGVHRLYHSAAIRQGVVFVNGSGWSSPKTDELMDKATVESDGKQRAAYYQELQKLLVEVVPAVWVHELQFPTVYSKKFRDLIVSPLGIFSSFDRAHQAE
jgi:peptide/nickel transport system substrate-binding protein